MSMMPGAIVSCCDSLMHLTAARHLRRSGVRKCPLLTNPNNGAIVTGMSAARNGIAGNHYRDAVR